MTKGSPNTEGIRTLALLSPTDIEELQDLEYLVEGILPAPAFGILYGQPGAGKTFIALSMALAVASGEAWLGRRTRQGRALYVAAEGALGMKKRLQAYRTRFGVEDENVRFIGEPFDIRRPAEVKALLTLLHENVFNPHLIIIDTLARVAVGADENSAKDMGQVVDGFETLKRKTGAAVLVIHHTRKDGGPERGSSALRGAADVMISCEGIDGGDTRIAELNCEKMKDDEPFRGFGVKLEKVELNKGGSSLVVTGTADLTKRNAANQDKIIEVLQSNFGEMGASHKDLLTAFKESGGGSESTFNRALRDAKSDGGLETRNIGGKNLYFVTPQAVVTDQDLAEVKQLFAEVRGGGN